MSICQSFLGKMETSNGKEPVFCVHICNQYEQYRTDTSGRKNFESALSPQFQISFTYECTQLLPRYTLI